MAQRAPADNHKGIHVTVIPGPEITVALNRPHQEVLVVIVTSDSPNISQKQMLEAMCEMLRPDTKEKTPEDSERISSCH